MNALIFGANGQDGHYLSDLCKAQGITPVGVSRSGDWVRADVSGLDQVRGLIKQYTPAYIFHLAARSTTRHEALFENHETISTRDAEHPRVRQGPLPPGPGVPGRAAASSSRTRANRSRRTIPSRRRAPTPWRASSPSTPPGITGHSVCASM